MPKRAGNAKVTIQGIILGGKRRRARLSSYSEILSIVAERENCVSGTTKQNYYLLRFWNCLMMAENRNIAGRSRILKGVLFARMNEP